MAGRTAAVRMVVLWGVWSGCAAEIGGATLDTRVSESGLEATRVALDFDVVGYHCPGGGSSCPASEEQCVCQDEYDHINVLRVMAGGVVEGRFLVTGGDARRGDVEGLGNRLAVNINELNADWESGAAGRADAMMAWARRQFPGGVPQWFFLNEISRARWNDTTPRGASYRRYVGDVVERLAVTHGRSVAVFSPFWRPGYDGRHMYRDAWARIARLGFVAVESYFDGEAIRATGFSEAACRDRYARSLSAYEDMGVPAGRLILTEHFGQTPGGTTWGRAGIPVDQWIRAIQVRTRAARSLPFAGYASYAWGANRAGRPSSERIAAADAYHRVGARRLVIGSHASAPEADAVAEPPPVVGEETGSAGTGTEPSSDAPPSDEPPPDEPPSDEPPVSEPPPASDPAPSCDGEGAACAPGSCCGSLACAGARDTCCRPVRSACESRGQCCAGRACVNGSCCVILGDGCAFDDQCCNFPAHQCVAGRCCVLAGNGCARDDQCCSGNCTLGRCR